jgi:3-hydroxypropanoate dehydrogenase
MLSQTALNQIFTESHTVSGFLDKKVDDAILQQAYDLAKLAPTAFNMSPMRIVFVKSAEGKAKLEPTLMDGNKAKTMKAPVTAIIADDLEFFNHLPRLFPFMDAKAFFVNDAAGAAVASHRNSTLQAAYFIIALRAVGLDVGPMSGFNNAAVDEAFFAGTSFKSNFLINIGYGDKSTSYPRQSRFELSEIAQFV